MAVADRLIEIDVGIRWEYILHEDSSKVYTFDMEMEDDEENEEPGKPGSEAKVQLPKSTAMQSLGEVVDKIDVLIELTLEHLKACVDKGRLPQVYDTLMHSFQSTIKGTLVVCPMVAVIQWRNEIARFTAEGSTKVLVYHGANRCKDVAELSQYDFVLTTYFHC